jgi:DNA-binding NtrC family response regulator/tetratricopeptide (TPR) repeat protein
MSRARTHDQVTSAAHRNPFDRTAQSRISALFRTCPPDQFLSELDSYAPTSPDETVVYEKLRGWALYDAGDYLSSRPHLSRALRLSEARSRDRSLIYGLFAETILRVGEFGRAEHYTRRALASGCERDPGNFLHAGHLLALGRIQAQSGHLTHAVDTMARAGALVDEKSTHWVCILTSLAQAHHHQSDLDEVSRAIEFAKRAQMGERQQAWIIASVECPLAIKLGDLDRARHVVGEATERFFESSGERARLLLLEMRANVLHAGGQFRESEEILREILTSAILGGRNSDAVSSASRALTESLMAQERNLEALETARLTARAGRMYDRAEWVTALRLQGECLDRLGETTNAQSAFREALSVHDCAEFDAERTRLERSMGRRLVAAVASRTSRPHGVQRLGLHSGRTLLTLDSALVDAIRAAARTDLPVVVEGETGTGKELVAHLIHELGPRSSGPLGIVDCTTLPEALADVELFGAARGAYTGAVSERAGLISQADGGTIVLDELPELSTQLQAKLLRVVQEGVYRRVGEDRSRRVRARFIATTNRGVHDLLASGALKPDLYYRLCGHRIELAPLRSRPEEIGPIASEIARASGFGMTSRALRLLRGQRWPGNVRELEMIVRLAVSSARGGTRIDASHIEPHLRGCGLKPQPSARGVGRFTTLRAERLAAERETLERLLQQYDGVVAEAARALGISRPSFYKAMRRTGLTRGERSLTH